MRTLFFIMQFVTLGLAAAFVVVFFKPELLEQHRPVVTIHTSDTTAGVLPSSVTGQSGQWSFSAAVDAAAPAVVSIYTKLDQRNLLQAPDFPDPHFGPDGWGTLPPSSLGSGVIFSEQGYILTNNHVVAAATEIHIMLSDGRSTQAQLVGTDPETDLAVLRIELESLPAITIGSSAQLRVGDVVLAIGNPFGVGQTVTQGIVSATGRNRLGLTTFENFIQTDAAINPGNSGGALINPRGELVGINTAIFSRTGGSQGIGFAIPVSLAQSVLTEIIEQGHVVRGWLGVRMGPLTPELAQQMQIEPARGVLIQGLFQDSPAFSAGLRIGDVITHINGEAVNDVRHMLEMIARVRPGETIDLSGIRDSKSFEAKAVVEQRPVMKSR